MTKLLLDSGDPNEYRTLKEIANKAGSELWGSTTNPSLIAKKLAGKKLTVDQAFALQKELVLEIISLVPGAVSAEVYSDQKTLSEEMIKQGREIATWHERVVVKLPTTFEGFKARTILRSEKIMTNNTLVFSQEQIFSICLHEHIIQKTHGPTNDIFPPFISPFVGRLDDIGEDGMMLIDNGMRIKKMLQGSLWMLEASVRKPEDIKKGIAYDCESITAPLAVYQQWFANQDQDSAAPAQNLKPIPAWTPKHDLLKISTIDAFMNAITSGKIDITHPLTEKGIARFVTDWQAILS